MVDFMDIRPAYFEVDIDRVLYNIDLVRKRVGKNVKIMVPVKGDFYGLGVRGLVPYVDDFVDYYALATVSEAIEIRRLGSKKEMLILSYTPRNQYKYLLDYNIMPAIFSYEDAKVLSDLALEREKIAKIHIKLDTGMTRIGFEINDKSIEDIEKISKLEGVKIDGIFTHFTSSEEIDKTKSYRQGEIYKEFCDKLKSRGVGFGKCHMSNSGAVVNLPQFDYDIVRAGSSIMGLMEKTSNNANLPVLPTCQLISKIVRIREANKGTTVGYNCTYTVEEDKTKIATIAVGYADGMKCQLSNGGKVLINDKLATIRGKICMDQFMVDVTDIDCEVGDSVIVFGYEGKAPTIADLSELVGTGNIDIISSIARRVPRVYKKDGKIVKVIDYLLD